jgi:toxin YoeB
MNLTFSEKTWEQYLYWQTADKKILEKINLLIKIAFVRLLAV